VYILAARAAALPSVPCILVMSMNNMQTALITYKTEHGQTIATAASYLECLK